MINLKTSPIFLLIILLYLSFYPSVAFSNNLSITDVSLESPDAEDETIEISFDISWENSWRNNLNYDAVWVFVKYSSDAGTTWNHATLASSGTNPSGFSTGSNSSLELITPSDKKGSFIQRSNDGQGSVSSSEVKLVWDWGEDDLEISNSAKVKVIGIEMVYIPAGSFYIGDGNGSSESSYSFHRSGYDNTSSEITSSSKLITCDINANDDIDTSVISIDGDGGISGNQNFPTGYQDFYIMKYEISENQWIDFFNSLTDPEKANRDITSASGKTSDSVVNRNTISWSSGDAVTTNGDRSCGYISWMDVCAYADWAGLRPMTELEYEKAARGANNSVLGEYAWGTTSATKVTTISGTEDGTETITNEYANSCFDNQSFSGGSGGTGPLRCGIFAKSNTSRTLSGASYYGVMELSGNLTERVVTVGNSTGRDFSGTHGDGILTSSVSYEGNATNSDWPGINATVDRGVTGASGSGLKGGSWNTTNTLFLTISDRTYASLSDATRDSSYGGRCVRTAP